MVGGNVSQFRIDHKFKFHLSISILADVTYHVQTSEQLTERNVYSQTYTHTEEVQ